jgi:hypothetical protein
MTQADRDRLVALKKAKKKLITQKAAAIELGVTERHVRRLLRALKDRGDRSVVHALRGRPSNRLTDAKTKEKALEILRQDVYQGFGPTLASEYLEKKHQVMVSRETLRGWMIEARLWQPRRQKEKKKHFWRQRRSRFGELVQWDTSDHDWLEGRGDKLLLIWMIDDATSRRLGRFVREDSTVENMNMVECWIRKHGRPLAYYTDKASLFQTAVKGTRDRPREDKDAPPLPPTQIVRALGELNIDWIAAHSPQAKGRVERDFDTAQDRLVKGLRVAGATTLEEANKYLEEEFLPWCNATLAAVPASADNAHRPLERHHDLMAILSHVEKRQVNQDYTVRFDSQLYRIEAADVVPGLRGGHIRVEKRRDGTIAMRFQDRYLRFHLCDERPKVQPKVPPVKAAHTPPTEPSKRNPYREFNLKKGPKLWQLMKGRKGSASA